MSATLRIFSFIVISALSAATPPRAFKIIEAGIRQSEDGPLIEKGTTFVPGEAHCMCLFEAQNSTIVKEVNEAAKLPFTRIVEAMDLTPKP